MRDFDRCFCIPFRENQERNPYTGQLIKKDGQLHKKLSWIFKDFCNLDKGTKKTEPRVEKQVTDDKKEEQKTKTKEDDKTKEIEKEKEEEEVEEEGDTESKTETEAEKIMAELEQLGFQNLKLILQTDLKNDPKRNEQIQKMKEILIESVAPKPSDRRMWIEKTIKSLESKITLKLADMGLDNLKLLLKLGLKDPKREEQIKKMKDILTEDIAPTPSDRKEWIGKAIQYLESPEVIEEKLLKELEARGEFVPIWQHVCTTVCQAKPVFDRYPLCNCNHVGERISKSLVRNAVSRIFANPHQSIMEPIVNGFDAYQKGVSTSIGKFGMGFFSFLHWLVDHPKRFLVVGTKTASKKTYLLLIRHVNGELAFRPKLIDGGKRYKMNKGLKCTTSVHLFSDELEDLENFTNVALIANGDPFTDADLKAFGEQIDRLRLTTSSQLYLNGESVNHSTSPETCVAVVLNKDEIAIRDAGSGISLQNILGSLLVPAVSTKTVKIAKSVTHKRHTGITYLSDHPSRFIITVSNIVVVQIPLDLEKVRANLKSSAMELFLRHFPPIEMRIDLPESTSLPVARDDVILSGETIQHFQEQLMKLTEELMESYRDVSVLQYVLDRYLTLSAQKNPINDIINWLYNYVKGRDVVLLPLECVELFVKFNLGMTHPPKVLGRGFHTDENQLMQVIVPSRNIDFSLFAERKVAYVDNYVTSKCSDFGTKGWLFVPIRYRHTKYIDYIRSTSPVYLTRSGNFFEILMKRKPSGENLIAIITASQCHGLFTDLYGRYSLEPVSEIKINDYFADFIQMIGHPMDWLLDRYALYYKCMIAVLSKIRTHLDTAHVTYGDSDVHKFTSKSILESRVAVGPLVKNVDQVRLKDKIKQTALKIELGMAQLIDLLPFGDVVDFFTYNWFPAILLLQSLPQPLDPFKNNMAALYYHTLFSCLNRVTDARHVLEAGPELLLKMNNGIPKATMEKIARYLETHVQENVLINEIKTVFTGYYRSLNPKYGIAILDIIKEDERPGVSLKTLEFTPFRSGPDEGYRFRLSRFINAVLNHPGRPDTRGDLEEVLVRAAQVGQDVDAVWQIIELAVNSGTTKESTEMAITEAVQNSIDAIRARPSREPGDVKVEYGRLPDKRYFFSITDDVGIPYESIVALTVPYYSQKSSGSMLTTGEMGNGLFNVYRDADLVQISTKFPGTDGFTIIDRPVRDEGGMVREIDKTLVFRSGVPKGTVISAVLPNNEDKFNLLFINLASYLSKLLTISERVARVDINGVWNNAGFFAPLYLEPSGFTSVTLFDSQYDPYREASAAVVALFYQKPESISYLQLRGVPFMPLAEFLENLPFLGNISHHVRAGIVINILTGFSPVQSRTSINLDATTKAYVMLLVAEACLIKHLSLREGNKYLENFTSTADPTQLKFSPSTSFYFTYGFKQRDRLSHFMTYYRSSVLKRNSLADIINFQIPVFLAKPENYKYEYPDASNPHLKESVEHLINGWFSNKKVEPPIVVKETTVKKSIPEAKTKPQLERESDPKKPPQGVSVDGVANLVNRIFSTYVTFYGKIARKNLRIKGFYSKDPDTRVAITESPTSRTADYRLQEHVITYYFGSKSESQNSAIKWTMTFKSILEGREETDANYKRMFFNTSSESCIMDHELEHARSHQASVVHAAHGKQTIQYGDEDPVTDDFERIAISTRKRMDQHGLSATFLAVVRDILKH